MKRTYSLAAKIVSASTALSFAVMGCTAGQEGELDPGDRSVTLEVFTNVPGEDGVRQMQPFGTTEFSLADFQAWERTFVVDGGESTDLADLRTGERIEVPLNTGETATLVRRGDRLELESFTGTDDGAGELPRGAVKAVRMTSGGIEIFLAGTSGPDPDTVVNLVGIDDLGVEKAALIGALALDALLVSLEDSEQIAPAVAIAIIAAIVGGAWLAVCGGLAVDCSYRCANNSGFETQCAGVTVSVNPTSVNVGGGYSCRCL